MDCNPLDTWFRFGLNLLSGGMMGYWWLTLRRERRELREVRAMKATLEAHLVTVKEILGEMIALPGDDDHPPSPLH